MRQNGVRNLELRCGCNHQAVMSADILRGEAEIHSIGSYLLALRRARQSECKTNWLERPDRPSRTGDEYRND
jgi:hypothetical protein